MLMLVLQDLGRSFNDLPFVPPSGEHRGLNTSRPITLEESGPELEADMKSSSATDTDEWIADLLSGDDKEESGRKRARSTSPIGTATQIHKKARKDKRITVRKMSHSDYRRMKCNLIEIAARKGRAEYERSRAAGDPCPDCFYKTCVICCL